MGRETWKVGLLKDTVVMAGQQVYMEFIAHYESRKANAVISCINKGIW